MLNQIRTLIRQNWNRADSLVLATNLLSFLLYLGNCWWHSLPITYAAALIPIALQTLYSLRNKPTLRQAVVFGAIVGFLWPVGEYLVVNSLGWWGSYIQPGPIILETPLYCILIGWLASTYCYYVGKRAAEWGAPLYAAGLLAGFSAFTIGLIGENFFVASRMWRYDPSPLDWWQVPAFVPIAYGIAFALLPLYRHRPLIPATLAFLAATLIISVSLGLATGFFPR